MSKFIFSLLCSLSLVSLLLTTSLHPVDGCREEDKAALLRIKSSLGNPSSLQSWSPEVLYCCSFWDGVYCDIDNNKVIYLWITNSDTIGPIPSSIGDLPDLQRLNIRGHPNLTGPIPESITKLSKLERLAIRGTSISGNIPNFLCNMSSLQFLDLSYNDFYGSIPRCFPGSLHNIDFTHNHLTGHIPSSLFHGYQGNDTVLNLRHNQLTGTIPRSFRRITFQNLDLSENQLTGDASIVLGESKFSDQIDLSNNNFDFDLSPVTYPLYLGSLDISHNRIWGSINQQITELQGLGVLDMSYNRLCGPIPSGLGKRPCDQFTFVHNKCLCGNPLPPCTA